MNRALILVALLLTGCVADYRWNGPGDLQADNYACNRDAAMVPNRPLNTTGVIQRNLYESCMRSKGYTLESKSWWSHL